MRQISLLLIFFIITFSCIPQNEIIYADYGGISDVGAGDIFGEEIPLDVEITSSTTRPAFVIESGRRNLPFPSDFFTVEDSYCRSGRRLNLSESNNEPLDMGIFFLGDQYLPALNKMCGFASFGPVVIPFVGRLDEEMFRDIDSNYKGFPVMLYRGGDSPEIVPVSISFVEKYIEETRKIYRYLTVRPIVPLEENTKYYYFITNRLLDSKGKNIIRDKGFERILSENSGLTDDEMRMREIVMEAISFLKKVRMDIPEHQIVLAGSFTTQNVRNVYKNERAFIYGEGMPLNLSFDVDGDGNEDIAEAEDYKGRDYSYISHLKYIVEGRFDAPNFMDKKGRMVFKDSENIEMQKIEKIQYTLFIPDGPEPHRIAIFQHGLSASRWDMSGIAEIFLKENIALIAIDAVTHGSRTADTSKSGFQFLNINDPLATRTNFMQTHFDLMRLVQLVRSFEGMDRLPYGPDGILDFDVERLFYIGNSLGGILGGVTISVEERLGLAVLNVAGGGLMDFVQSYLYQAAPSLATMPEVALFAVVAQNLLDGIDPAVHSIYTDRSKNILLQEACGDTTVPNPTTESLARALGLYLIKPVFREVPYINIVDAPYTGRGLTQFHPAGHGFLFSRSGSEAEEGERGRMQVIHFCKTYLENGEAEIKSFLKE